MFPLGYPQSPPSSAGAEATGCGLAVVHRFRHEEDPYHIDEAVAGGGMALRHISFDQVDEACLQRLIETGAAESRGIEYKSATYGGNDDARAEFLADVSSLANTAGGDLIIGIAETNGVPTALVPITGDFDAECLRLEGMARDGLDPRIPN